MPAPRAELRPTQVTASPASHDAAGLLGRAPTLAGIASGWPFLRRAAPGVDRAGRRRSWQTLHVAGAGSSFRHMKRGTEMGSEQSPPLRGQQHDALEVFLGDWSAEGLSFGGTDQRGPDPRAHGVPWKSTHSGRWHTGRFFLVQDERARIDGVVFDTLSVIGLDAATGGYFARTFENHGFYRHYRLSRDGDLWLLSGDTERASITFRDNNRTQVIAWEWKVDSEWLPLCDRTAVRHD